MKTLIIVQFILLTTSIAYSAPLIVEEVNGRKATVYVPPGIEVKPGDTLQPESTAQLTPQPTPPPATPTMSAPEPNSTPVVIAEGPVRVVQDNALRPRTHNINVEFNQLTDKYDVDINGVDFEKTQSKEYSVQYSRNFGHFQPGFLVGIAKKKGSADIQATTGMIFLRVNFIENAAPNDLVPFAGIGFGKRQEDVENEDGTLDFLLSGDMTLMALGVTWYPFSELFGFEALLGQWEAKFRYSGEPDIDVDVDFKREFLGLGAVLSF